MFIKSLQTGIAGLALAWFGSHANAGFIDFETVPGGTPTEGMSINTQYLASFGVKFSLEGGGSPVLAAYGGERTGFQGYNDIPDMAAPGQGCGDFFLTDDGIVGGPPAALVIDYTSAVNAASGRILDIDQQEAWLVEARDASNNVVDSLVLDTNTTGSGNGMATLWSFDRNNADIYSVRISYVGLTLVGIGLAFDAFWTDEAGGGQTTPQNTPEPTTLALLGTGLLGVVLGRRKKKWLGARD